MAAGNVRDQVVAISGASSGLGLAAAQALAAQGCRVVGGGRRFPRDGLGFETLALDVCDAGSAQGFVDQVLARHGRLDALVNCAGLGMTGPLEATADDEERALFEVNVLGMLRLCRAAIPHLRQRPGSRIVNVSSIAGTVAIPFHTAYCASKFAVEGLSASLQHELRPFGVHVSVIRPGDFLTESTERYATVRGAGQAGAYRQAMQRAIELMEADCRKGHDLSPFVRVLTQALSAPRPRGQYVAAVRLQVLQAALARLAPAALVSAVVARLYR